MTDQSPMPFGQHANRPMEKVPAQYLLWLWDNGLHDVLDRAAVEGTYLAKQIDVARYIRDNFSALESEAKDYLVIHRP